MESELRLDAFRDRLAQKARDSGAAALAHQCRGRAMDNNESILADALMEIFAKGTHDFTEVAAELAVRGVVAPHSGRTDWTQELLTNELSETNAELDKAYESYGYGA
ncbi:MAG: recombinase-like helix-turn-helix domain-containing protein [Paracoccaceae bacterium]